MAILFLLALSLLPLLNALDYSHYNITHQAGSALTDLNPARADNLAIFNTEVNTYAKTGLSPGFAITIKFKRTNLGPFISEGNRLEVFQFTEISPIVPFGTLPALM